MINKRTYLYLLALIFLFALALRMWFALQTPNFQIGEAYYQNKKYEPALTWYQKVLETYPDDPIAQEAFWGAIWSFGELGRLDEARELKGKFIGRKPDIEK